MNDLQLNFIKDNLTKEEKEKVSEECECSLNTVYSYIGGKRSNVHLAKAIFESSNLKLRERGVVYIENTNV